MSRKNTIYVVIIVACALLSIQLNITNALRSPSLTIFDPLVDVCDLVHRRYVSETEDQKLITGAINGMLHQLDPHSEYIPTSEVEEFHKHAGGSYEGIGISLDSQDGYLVVISPFEDSPAFKAGVRAGDVILEVDDKDAKDLSTTQAVKILSGTAGTQVRLKVVHRDGSEEEVSITRAEITVPTVKGWRRNSVNGQWDYMLDDEGKIGYLRITQFTGDTVARFDQAIQTCLDQGLRALIMDLRSNPGGLMTAALGIADRFLDDEVILSTRGAHTTPNVSRGTSENNLPNFHLVILINQGSASASEIVSGSLQAHNRAVIVGQRSWGKGSVQEIFEMPETGALLKLTTAYYYLPDGRCVHRLPGAKEWGVEPDIKEELDPAKVNQLNDLFDELTIDPLAEAQAHEGDSGKDEASKITADAELKQKQLEKWLDLDSQLAQAFKQCQGLIRARPSLNDLIDVME